jgi:hypothetical protein
MSNKRPQGGQGAARDWLWVLREPPRRRIHKLLDFNKNLYLSKPDCPCFQPFSMARTQPDLSSQKMPQNCRPSCHYSDGATRPQGLSTRPLGFHNDFHSGFMRAWRKMTSTFSSKKSLVKWVTNVLLDVSRLLVPVPRNGVVGLTHATLGARKSHSICLPWVDSAVEKFTGGSTMRAAWLAECAACGRGWQTLVQGIPWVIRIFLLLLPEARSHRALRAGTLALMSARGRAS